MRALIVVCLGLLLAPLAQAQFIDCSGGCSDTLYGLGNDPPEGPYLNTFSSFRTGPGDGSCGPEFKVPIQGQMRIRDQDSCAVSATTRCPVEIPQAAEESGILVVTTTAVELGPLGSLVGSGAFFHNMGGNIGHRQLTGTCTLDAGEECALDSDCPSGAGCRSTCNSDPGTPCASQADCPAADCRTEIEWDGIGLCTDEATVCTSDADCPGEDVCFAGFSWVTSPESCLCCQSSLGVVCGVFGFPEYPAVFCGSGLATPMLAVAAPDWLFAGGRGTSFDMETIQVPGQLEGLCNANPSRPCGARGDFWAGGANGKCAGAPPCAADPFDIDNPALQSGCDDVAFGGVAGDFCDLSEDWIRFFEGRNPDGTQNASICTPGQTLGLVGTPGELCALPDDIPDADPQPGCQLINYGVVSLPDLDCDGLDDTEEGRCQPMGGTVCSDPADCPPCADDGDCASGNCINNGDLCPFIGERNWFLDSNNDDIGDECQCGDGTGDGAISSPDIAAAALCANGAAPAEACDATLLDATGDNATTAEDIGGIVSVVNGVIPTSAVQCVRNLDTTL